MLGIGRTKGSAKSPARWAFSPKSAPSLHALGCRAWKARSITKSTRNLNLWTCRPPGSQIRAGRKCSTRQIFDRAWLHCDRRHDRPRLRDAGARKNAGPHRVDEPVRVQRGLRPDQRLFQLSRIVAQRHRVHWLRNTGLRRHLRMDIWPSFCPRCAFRLSTKRSIAVAPNRQRRIRRPRRVLPMQRR